MDAQRIASMLSQAVSFDTETHKVQPGLGAPPLVCASVARVVSGNVVGVLLDKARARDRFLQLLQSDATIVGANIAYDMSVMAADFERRGIDILPLIFAAYEAGRVFDIQIAEMLHAIALGLLGKDPRTGKQLSDPLNPKKKGHYSLAITTDLVLGRKGAKANDKWRKSYALLEDIPIEKWREVAGSEAVDYPVDDAVNTLECALAQCGHIDNIGVHQWNSQNRCEKCNTSIDVGVNPLCINRVPRRNMHDLSTQCYTHFAMYLGAVWGLTSDPVAVAKLKHNAVKDSVDDAKPFIAAGIIREDDTENQAVLMKLVAQAYGSKDPCPVCANTTWPSGRDKGQPAPGKVPSQKTNGKTLVNCEACSGTALQLTSSVPRSDGGAVSKGRDPLAESGNELLMAYAAFGEDRKIRTTYVPFLEEGLHPALRLAEGEDLETCLHRIELSAGEGRYPITLSPNVLLETNRTSYRDKTQTMPREGGVRDCFEARPGTVYYSNDYGGIELCTWAQICLWMVKHSELAKALNQGLNVHGALGAEMAGESYEAFMKKVDAGDKSAKAFRQAAKPGNFGFPGGMSPVRLVHQQREQGPDTPHPSGPIEKKGVRLYRGLRFCLLIGGAQRCGEKMIYEWNKEPISPTCAKCVECATWIKDGWRKRWPEEKEYFGIIKRISDQGWQKHPISNRIRGGIGYCDGANGFFQELAAQGAKDAERHVVREQYDASYRPADLNGERSILFNNSRNIALLHDELLGEAIISVAPECSERVGVVMVQRMKRYVPDVRVTAEPTLMARWFKQATCVRDANGRLQVWTPKS